MSRPSTATSESISLLNQTKPALRRAQAFVARPTYVVGAIVLVAAAVAAFFSRQVVGFEPDEVGYTRLAIGIAHALSPITLSYNGGQRLNQLYPLLISPFWGLFGNMTAFRLVHIWNALLMASTAIPVYLLAREVVRERWACYLAAALIAFSPWMTLSLAELTEVAAFPACAWSLLAMQRTLAKPSAARDLLALGMIAVASYGRLQLVVLAPVLIVAMVLHELGYARMGSAHDRGFRQGCLRMARRHPPLTIVGLVGLLVGVPLLLSGTLASAFGFYGDTLTGLVLNGATLDIARSYFTFLAIGLGILPTVLTLGFIGESLISPVSRRIHAFACLALVTIVALVLQVAEVTVRFDEGVLQERYLFYILPLLAVGMCAGLLHTRHPVKMILGGAALVAALIATTHYQVLHDAFFYEVSPGLTGFYDWVQPFFGGPSGQASNSGVDGLVPLGTIVLLGGLTLSVVARKVSGARTLAVAGTIVVLFCGAEAVNALSRAVHGNAIGLGFGSGSLHDVEWVDQSVPSGSGVAQIVSNLGGQGTSRSLWESSEFWNRSIVGAYSFGGVSDSYFATAPLSINEGTGVVNGPHGTHIVVPEPYVVTSTRGFPIELAGKVVARSRNQSMQLMLTARPLRASWAVFGVSSNGWLTVNHPATLLVYASGGVRAYCQNVSLSLALSALSFSSRWLRLSGPGFSRQLRFAPGQTKIVKTRVCTHRNERERLQMLNEQAPGAASSQVTLQLHQISVESK